MEMDEASCGTHGGTQSLAAVACCPGAPWSALAIQQIGGGRKKKWQTRGGDEAVFKMCRAVPAATYDSAPVVWNAVVGYCGHRTRGPVAGGQR